MKKLNILFIALVLIFTSCSKDDDSSGSETSGSIVGTWSMVDYDYRGTTVSTFQGQTITQDFVGEAFDIDYTLTFEENPNNLVTAGGFSLKLTTTTAGQTTTQTIDDFDTISDGTWEIVDGELLTKANNGEGKSKIEELTESSLILSIKQEIDLSQAGASVISNINAVLMFER